MSPSRQRVLGLDFGGVIRQTTDSEGDEVVTGWSYLKGGPVPDSFEATRVLAYEMFDWRVWIVSRCQPRMATLSRSWLAHYCFFERTGIPKSHFCPCNEREEKARICQEHNITDFVDNRLEVLIPMVGVVPNLYLFSPPRETVRRFKEFPPQVQVARNWRTLVRLIRNA